MGPRPHVLGPVTVARVGWGAMRLPGRGVSGPPRGCAAAIAADPYDGPGAADELIRAALSACPAGLAPVTQAGARRDACGVRYDRPAELRRGIEDNLRSLAAGHLAAVHLRRMDGAPPGHYFTDQPAAMVAAREDGPTGGTGLRNITPGHPRRAPATTGIARAQNLLNPAGRPSTPVLAECHARGTAFAPSFPPGPGSARGGNPAQASPAAAADRPRCTPAQVAPAWPLDLQPEALLIPGTSPISHLEHNMAAATIELDPQARDLLSQGGDSWQPEQPRNLT